jgi:hypothetical protein
VLQEFYLDVEERGRGNRIRDALADAVEALSGDTAMVVRAGTARARRLPTWSIYTICVYAEQHGLSDGEIGEAMVDVLKGKAVSPSPNWEPGPFD